MVRQTNASLLACTGLCVLIVLSACGAGAAAAPSGVLQEAPLNPAFSEAVGNVPDFVLTNVQPGANGNGYGIPSGVIPSPVDRSYLKGKNIGSFASVEPTVDESSPATVESETGDYYYDLRIGDLVTSVKDQGNLGTCWAFATYGSLESVLLQEEDELDFSESNLANTHGFDLAVNSGGNMDMSTAYLTRWSGPVSEADEPYYTEISNESLPQQKNVQEVLFIPGRSGPLDNGNLKWVIQNYGGIYSTIYWDNEDPADYNSQTDSFYNPDNTDSNHAITLVGWNDSYSRTLFATQPPGDGAFIAKNSWGTYWGDEGYFYISYYDPLIGTSNAVFTAEPLDTYTGIYQYDPLGLVNTFGYKGITTAWFANVFTAEADEDLSAVGFYTNDVDCLYEVYIYTDPSNGPISLAGPVSTTSGTIAIPGYHTVDLTTPIALVPGQDFSVVVKMTTTDYTYPIAIEYPWPGYSSSATAETGESYYGPDGSHWYDMASNIANANVCLKAYTVQAGGNRAPNAVADQYDTDEDTILVISTPGILANDYDLDGNTLTAILGTDVAHGELYLQADGSFSYMPATGFTGTDVFTYRASDGELTSAAAEVMITVNEVNSAPIANADTYTTNEDTKINVMAPGVLGNDVDADGDTLSAELSAGPNHGTLVLNTEGSFTYTPIPDYNGPDAFTYRTYDGLVSSASATVSLTITPVNDAPIARNDAATTTQDMGIIIAVLANDEDADGDTLSITGVSDPSHGTASIHSNAVSYTPENSYFGEDSFTYTISDNNGGSDSATVSITINKPAIAPESNFTCSETTILVRETVAFTDTSANDPTSWSWSFGDGVTSTAQNPVHQYKKPGTYTVSLAASNDVGTDTVTMEDLITVLKFAPSETPTPSPTQPPDSDDLTADFSVNVTSGNLPLTVAFTDESVGNPTTYEWDFGDGSIIYDDNPNGVHTYTTKGLYTVSLTIRDDKNGSATVVKKRLIKVLP